MQTPVSLTLSRTFAEVIAEARLDAADPKTWYLAAAQGTDAR